MVTVFRPAYEEPLSVTVRAKPVVESEPAASVVPVAPSTLMSTPWTGSPLSNT